MEGDSAPSHAANMGFGVPSIVAGLLLFSTADAAPGQLKVTICHRTNSASNPYVSITVASDAVDGDLDNDRGQGDHLMEHTGPVFDPAVHTNGDDWGDIIPVVDWINGHPGMNWNQAGQDIWNNGCNLPGNQPQVVPTFTISGSIYVDVNKNGLKDAREPGIAGVVVFGPFGISTTTDSVGTYTFSGVLAGTYAIVVDSAGGFFSGASGPYFRARATEMQVTVGPSDSHGNHNDVVFLLSDLNDDVSPNDPDQDGITLMGKGHTIGFWKHQLKTAMGGKMHQVSGDTLDAYLSNIQAIAVGTVFNYAAAAGVRNSRFQMAFDIMNAKTSDAIGLLRKQLQGLMLNHQHGLGLDLFHRPLQGLVISVMQAVAASGETESTSEFARSTILSCQKLADDINNMDNYLV